MYKLYEWSFVHSPLPFLAFINVTLRYFRQRPGKVFDRHPFASRRHEWSFATMRTHPERKGCNYGAHALLRRVCICPASADRCTASRLARMPGNEILNTSPYFMFQLSILLSFLSLACFFAAWTIRRRLTVKRITRIADSANHVYLARMMLPISITGDLYNWQLRWMGK